MHFRHRFVLPLVLLLALTAAMEPPRAPVWGHVVDGVTGAPVVDAVIRMQNASVEARTDDTGRFDFGLREFGEDSLSVTHDGYQAARILLGGEESAPIDVRLAPRGVAVAGVTADQIQDFAQTSGGSAWLHEDFWRYVPESRHALDLLLSSGLVDAVDDRRGPGTCVVIAGAEDCATLWLHDAPVTNTTFDAYLPTQVIGFVVVPEGGFTRTLGNAAATSGNGVVAVFMRPVS